MFVDCWWIKTKLCNRFIFIRISIIARIEKGLKKEGIVEFLENLAKLITPEYIDALYLKTYQILEEMGYTTDRLMFELMQPCTNMIKNCAWLGKIVPCDTLFRVARSSEGFCCSFNYKALKGDLEMYVNCTRFSNCLNLNERKKSISYEDVWWFWKIYSEHAISQKIIELLWDFACLEL